MSSIKPTLEKTTVPGVYRRGKSYVVRYQHRGKDRKRCAATFEQARATKQSVETDKRRGRHREATALTFAEYATGWLDTYTGRSLVRVQAGPFLHLAARLVTDRDTLFVSPCKFRVLGMSTLTLAVRAPALTERLVSSSLADRS
jgi:hypothetical protein